MKKSIFYFLSSNLVIILIVTLILTYLYYYICEDIQYELFIPNKPNMNEYYIHRVKNIKNLKKPSIKYFMAIPYGDNLVSKNNLWNMIRDCNFSKKFVPKSFIVENFYDLQNLKKTHNNEKIYILKKNIQRKQGLKLFRGKLESLISEYKDGGFKVIQEFIRDPYLVNNRIVVLRLYLIITKKKNYNFYIHNYGKCLYTSKDFSLINLEEDRLITNNRSKLDKNFSKNVDEFVKKEKISKKILHKPIENVIKCFKKFISENDNPTHQQFTFFQTFGVDLIIDKNKNPLLLEINKNPDINTFYYQEDKLEKGKLGLDVKYLIKYERENNFTKI